MTILNHQYYRNYGWMRNELGLKNNDLDAFSIIFGFSFVGEGKYTGGAKGIAEWRGCTKAGATKNLNNLLERNLIIKEKTGTGFNARCQYSCNFAEVERLTGLDVRKMHLEQCKASSNPEETSKQPKEPKRECF